MSHRGMKPCDIHGVFMMCFSGNTFFCPLCIGCTHDRSNKSIHIHRPSVCGRMDRDCIPNSSAFKQAPQMIASVTAKIGPADRAVSRDTGLSVGGRGVGV